MRLHALDDTPQGSDTIEYEHRPLQKEEQLETLLQRNSEILLDEPILIIARQARLDVGIPDLVGIDQFGNVIVSELKIGRSGSGSASEETILGQPQTYASALSRFNYDDLDELYREYRSRVQRREWDIEPAVVSGETLESAVESRFGKGLAEPEFNTEQRIVVVAEKITRKTAANARFLLEQGLHFQCLEVRRFSLPDDEDDIFIGSSTVVDYDINRIRPSNRQSPTYPDLVRKIVEPIFPDLRDILRADKMADVFPTGFDVRTPYIESRHPDHLNGVRYYLAAKPDQEEVVIGLHNMDEDPDVNERIRRNEDRFREIGLAIKENTRYNLLQKKWSVGNTGDAYALAEDIGTKYSRMILLGHEVLIDAND